MTACLIAVTGASGFVGRAVVAELGHRGAAMRLLARNPAQLAVPMGASFVQGDLADAGALAALCDGADVVIHIAGAITAVNRDAYFAVNGQGAAQVAAAAQKAGVRRFVHVSSLAAREPELSDYAASKRAGEHLVAKSCRAMPYIMLRPPAVYGPGDVATLPLFRQLTQSIALVPGKPTNRLSLIHVADLARALVDAAVGDAPSGTIHEMDDGKASGYSWAELCAIAGAQEGYHVRPVFIPRAFLEVPAYLAAQLAAWRGVAAMLSPSKLGELYHPDCVARGPALAGFVPEYDFARGFAETVAAYRAQGWLPPRRAASTNTRHQA